jgi:hypothetical protein
LDAPDDDSAHRLRILTAAEASSAPRRPGIAAASEAPPLLLPSKRERERSKERQRQRERWTLLLVSDVVKTVASIEADQTKGKERKRQRKRTRCDAMDAALEEGIRSRGCRKGTGQTITADSPFSTHTHRDPLV